MLQFHCNILKIMNQWVFSNRLWKILVNICYRNILSCRILWHFTFLIVHLFFIFLTRNHVWFVSCFTCFNRFHVTHTPCFIFACHIWSTLCLSRCASSVKHSVPKPLRPPEKLRIKCSLQVPLATPGIWHLDGAFYTPILPGNFWPSPLKVMLSCLGKILDAWET